MQQVKKAIILIDDIIGKDWWTGDGITAKDIRAKVNQFDADNSVDEVEVLINSPGGSFSDGTSIYNIIEGAAKIKNIHIEGIAASWGATISFAKGKPTMAPNALLMLHSASTGMWGNSKDLRETADTLDKFDETLAISIAQHTGLSVDDVKGLYLNHKDNWLTAQEAEAAGLVTIKGKATSDVSDVKNLSIEQVFARFAAKHSAKDKQGFLEGFAKAFKNLLPGAKTEEPAAPITDTTKTDDNMKIVVAKHPAIVAALGLTVDANATEVEVNATADMLEVLNKKLEECAKAAIDLATANKNFTDTSNKLKEVTDELASIKGNGDATTATTQKEVEANGDKVYTREELKALALGKPLPNA